jgi:hypothetical protein
MGQIDLSIAIFRANQFNSGFASLFVFTRCLRNPLLALPSLRATSVSQMAVSTASIYGKATTIPLSRQLVMRIVPVMLNYRDAIYHNFIGRANCADMLESTRTTVDFLTIKAAVRLSEIFRE